MQLSSAEPCNTSAQAPPNAVAVPQVVFRPLKLQQYSDHIEMFVNSASFIVLVEAYPPATLVEVRGGGGAVMAAVITLEVLGGC